MLNRAEQLLERFGKHSGGFTLLEMLIVIVIIGILAVIIVPGLSSGPQRARDAQRKSHIRSVKNALETYYNDQVTGGFYPNVSGGAVTNSYTAFSDATNGLASKLVTAYLPSMPVDPTNSGVFKYQYMQKDTTATSAQAMACLQNTKDTQVGTTTATYATPFAAQACTSAIIYNIQTLN